MKNGSGKWTKYGGGKAVHGHITEDWICQSCALRSGATLTPQMVLISEAVGYIRVCDPCYEEDVLTYRSRVSLLSEDEKS